MEGPETPDVSSTGPAASPRGQRRSGEGETTDALAANVATLRPVTVAAATVGVLAALGLGVATGATAATLLAVVSASAFAVGVPGITGEDPVRIAAGTVLGVLSAGGVAVAAVTGPAPLVLALTLATFGAVAIPAGSVGGDRLTEATATLLYALVPPGVVAVLAILARSYGPVLDGTLGTLASGGAGQSVFTASVLFAAATLSTLVAVRTVPLVRLAPKSKRDRVRGQVVAAERALRRIAMLGGLFVVASTVLWAMSGPGRDGVPALLEALGAAAGSPALQYPLLAIAGLGLVVAASTVAVRQTGGSLVQVTRRGVAMATGVVLVPVLVVGHAPLYSTVLDSLGPDLAGVVSEVSATVGQLATVLTGSVLLVMGFVVVVLALPAAVGVGIAPDRAAPAAFGAAGLVGGSILAAESVGPPVVFAGVAAGMVVWDLGEFGVGVVEEVGADSAGRGEVIHAVATLAVSVVVVVGATLAHAVVTDVSVGGRTALAAVAVLFLGVVLLVSVVRG
jgi:hypothetical protein